MKVQKNNGGCCSSEELTKSQELVRERSLTKSQELVRELSLTKNPELVRKRLCEWNLKILPPPRGGVKREIFAQWRKYIHAIIFLKRVNGINTQQQQKSQAEHDCIRFGAAKSVTRLLSQGHMRPLFSFKRVNSITASPKY